MPSKLNYNDHIPGIRISVDNLYYFQKKSLFMRSRPLSMDIMNYSLCEKYEHLKKFGDRLSEMKDLIDWDGIKPLLSDLYKNDTEKGGRPNFDPVFMVKVMFLQSLYGLVDEAKEIELYANIRFMNFLDYPESMPDARTIWLFGEKIVDNHKDKEIWK